MENPFQGMVRWKRNLKDAQEKSGEDSHKIEGQLDQLAKISGMGHWSCQRR
jgi:hypothetical protein